MRDTRAEEALKESERRYREFFDNSSDAVFVHHLDGEIVEVNRAAQVLTGYTGRELLGMNVSGLLPPESFTLSMDKQRALLDGEALPQRYEVELLRKDSTRLVIESVARLLSKNDEPAGVQVIVRDVTERKKMEKRLEEREKTFRAIAEQSSDGILIVTPEGDYVYVNNGASGITGYSVEELLRMNLFDLVHPEELPKFKERSRERRDGKHIPRQYESVFIRKDGKAIPVELVEAKTLWYGEPTVEIVFRDIAERKRLRNYVTEITWAQEEERKRIARELHDDTIQSLAALSLEIQAITRDKGLSLETLQRLEKLRRETGSIIDGVRRFSYELRPAVLDQLGLIPALELLTSELNRGTKIKSHVEVIGFERRLAPDLELALFRIVQEALRNIRKHAQAKKASVVVEFNLDNICLGVTDDGQGFELPESMGDFAFRRKMGLVGMQERARLFGSVLRNEPRYLRVVSHLVRISTKWSTILNKMVDAQRGILSVIIATMPFPVLKFPGRIFYVSELAGVIGCTSTISAG
jgi:two-component system sensor histidine kinase UhpB